MKSKASEPPVDSAWRKVIRSPQNEAKSLQNFVAESVWGKALDARQLQWVLEEIREKKLKKGESIFRQGDAAEFWYGVMEGDAAQSIVSSSGRLTEVSVASNGTWFGEGTLLKRERWQYEANVLRPTRIAMVPYGVFHHLRQTNIPFNHYLQTLLNSRLGACMGMLAAERTLDPEARLAKLIVSFYQPDLYPERGAFLPVDQGQLALLAGLSRQRTNAALGILQGLGLIQIVRRGIAVTNLAGLRQFAP